MRHLPKKQGVKMNKIVCALGGVLYISLKYDFAGGKNEFLGKLILHF